MNIHFDSLIIKKAADGFNSRYNPAKVIPVPIDSIIETHLKIDIVPIAGLREELDNDGFISRDFTTIHIDQYIYISTLRSDIVSH